MIWITRGPAGFLEKFKKFAAMVCAPARI